MSKSIVNVCIVSLLCTWGAWTGDAWGQSGLTGLPTGDGLPGLFHANARKAGPGASDPLWTDALWQTDQQGSPTVFRGTDSSEYAAGSTAGIRTMPATRAATSTDPTTRDRDIPVLNQLYMIIEKPLTATGNNWGIGGRWIFMYGYDFFLTQSNGVERRENGAQRWNAQGQHYGIGDAPGLCRNRQPDVFCESRPFYTIIGYEGVPSINSFFYSKSFAYQFAGPSPTGADWPPGMSMTG